ncbi:MAG: ABC transporter ATP-binding protein [Planctomycetia bacterium]|nr:ABC transporter ATP-binding protein [Planctomycetia bacterium]
MPADRPVLLRLASASRTFQMGEVAVVALRNVTLDIYEGEFLVMVGPSGSGKTTLLNLVGGMDQPTEGSVWYRDIDLATLSTRALTRYRRETIGFVFQFYNLIPNLTARENITVATEISQDPLDPDEALRLVGLEPRRDHFPAQLSGGEQQRVSIARAVAKNPELLLCDEPTGALDFSTGKQLLWLLLQMKNRLGKTIIVITHNVAIGEVADRVVRLRSGEIAETHVNEKPRSPEEISW